MAASRSNLSDSGSVMTGTSAFCFRSHSNRETPERLRAPSPTPRNRAGHKARSVQTWELGADVVIHNRGDAAYLPLGSIGPSSFQQRGAIPWLARVAEASQRCTKLTVLLLLLGGLVGRELPLGLGNELLALVQLVLELLVRTSLIVVISQVIEAGPRPVNTEVSWSHK